jgi:hypothetical protein
MFLKPKIMFLGWLQSISFFVEWTLEQSDAAAYHPI